MNLGAATNSILCNCLTTLTYDYGSFDDELCSLKNDFNESTEEFKSQEQAQTSFRPLLISKLTTCQMELLELEGS
jgi:hypothetical protein